MLKIFSKEPDQKQKTERFGCLLMLALAAIYAFVCTPIYYVSNSNVLLQNSVFTFVWDFVNDAVQYFYYWISFAFVIFFAVKYAIKETVRLLTFFAACSVGRYFFGLIIVLALDKDWEMFGYEMKQIVEVTLGDLLMMGFAVLLIYLILTRRSKNSEILKSFQSASVLQLSHPLMGCMLAVAFVPALMRILSRIWFDLFLGAPQGTGDLISMVVYYTGDVISGVIGYLAIFLIVAQMNIKSAQD